MKRCYYETLEVDRNADESKLKAAFRKLAMKWHPDKNPGDATSEMRFKEINEAYEVLKDGDKRAAYDRYGHAAFEQGGAGGGGPGFGAGFASSFSDIFEDLFGMAGQRARGGGRERGADLRYNMEITLEDAFPSCAGSGRVTRERMLSVNIPPGVEDGTRIRLAGEGEAGFRGGPPGDLYIFLSLGAHEFFQRDGADLHCRVPISMVTAALGGDFEVPSIDGSKTRVKVPGGTQSGRRFRLSGKGMPVLRSKQMGDMYVQVVVETPQNLTKRQRELLAEFEKLSSKDTQ